MALLVDIEGVAGSAGMVRAGTAEFYADGSARGDRSSEFDMQFPAAPPRVDLSRADRNFSDWQNEVFHYQSIRDLVKITCRLIDMLGDDFDVFMFHSEFRLDSQESSRGTTA